MPKAQAEVLVKACVGWLNGSKDNLATKDDLNNLEKRFGDKLEQTELRILNKILVMQIASVGLIIAALGVFFAALQYWS